MNCKQCKTELLEWEEPFNICMICDSERKKPVMEFKLHE